MKGEIQFMKKRTKKIIALLLAIVMAISLMPLAALAEETKQGEVAAVVYGPDFTDLIGDGKGDIGNLVTVLKNATEKAVSGEDMIPEAVITLTSVDDPTKVYTMKKTDELRWGQSLNFESESLDKMKADNAKATAEQKEKVDDLQQQYDKARGLAKLALGTQLVAAKLSYDGLALLGSLLASGADTVLDQINIAEAGRGRLYDTYTSGKIDEGQYRMHIEEFKGEGYVLTDYTDRDQLVTVTENDGKPQFIGEKVSRHWAGDFGLSTYKFDFDLQFPGFWIRKLDIGFEFSNTDVTGVGINGSEFAMVNREQVETILAFMKDAGEKSFNKVMANFKDEEVFNYKEVLALHKDLINTENTTVPIDLEVAQKIVMSYMALFTGVDQELLASFNAARENGMVLPAVLVATSETVDGRDGVVRFSENSNQTLTWMMSALDKIFENVAEMNDTLKGIFDLYTILKGISGDLINSVGYDIAKMAGLVSDKMPSGTYWMFQTEAGDTYQRSPLVYTMRVTWDNPEWVYATVAELGVIGPYVAKGFYEYVRNTTFEGPVAKAFKAMALGYEFGSDATLYNLEILDNINDTLMTGSLKLDDENSVKLMGAYSAYIADTMYRGLGLNVLYNSRKALMEGMNAYLLDNAKASRGLMGYVNEQAKKAKSVYTDKVDLNWTFYNLDTSPTTTATKLIQKSTDDITKIMNDSTSYRAIGEDGKPADNSPRGELVAKTGAQVKSIVSKIGTQIEATNKKIADGIKEAAKKVFGNIGTQIKTGIEKLVSGLFSNLFGGNKTANA